MRTRGMGRTRGARGGRGARTGGLRVPTAVLACGAALAVLAGCTVEGPDGERHSPVRIELPSGKPSPGPSAKSAPPDDRPSAPAAPAVLWERGDEGRDIRELQARLRQVAWLFDGPTGVYDDLTERAVRGFQGKRGLPRTGRTDRVTWERLLRMTREPGTWDLYLMGGQPADPPDPRCLTGRVLCVSKKSRTLRWMVDGRTELTVPVRFGSEYTPTREGVFSVYWKSRHHVSTLYDSPMPYAMFFSGGQAVHYSADFAARGYAGASHGCVNVADEPAIREMFARVRTGDKVVVHR
ncbi:L,D-transpeptidase family protein [Streptomyces sp. KAU_LT]|uniref:L,D-transpeptidase family protein n=1 Tax=Streptomyces sp. KAU_LT TaxID=3046669 RepID=UPI0024B827CC|nr:L,D-transpeptidase family protein [Streptomyces sp. KAU_LT]MDI9831610.1 L,D-transpeptidase family protein [Streptomyces sp. KAU_LT]